MDKLEFKQRLKNKFSRLDVIKFIHDDQIAVRCPFCGDSIKSHTSAHFYVKINMREDEPVLFHCFRCEVSGILTPSVMRTLNINDLQLNSGLLAYNSKAMKSIHKSLGITNNSFNFIIPHPDENDIRNIRKKEYIENRLGVEFSFEELVNLKTIFALGQFLKVNDIDKITTKQDKALLLHNDYVGFLSAKNEFINFRDVTGKQKKRYEKYSIYNRLYNTRKFYTIPNKIDILTTKKITLNIAEGTFDIWGVYNHLYERETKNMIYSAVCGAGYITVIKYFIQMGIIGNVDVNIYSDNDRQPYFYKEMVKQLGLWVDNFNLYYNEKSKDYGVPKDKIKIIKKRI